MNGKEKEAIEYLERHILPYVREGKIKFMLNEVILNLIKKQQKEIKARLEERDSLYKMMSAKDDKIDYLEDKIEQMEENYISKDKIRKEIEEIKNCRLSTCDEQINMSLNERYEIEDEICEYFEELLGGTNGKD